MNKTKEQKVSLWLIIIAVLLAISFVATDPLTFISGIIGIACGFKCSKWAKQINKGMNWAFVIGFLFNLVGLLVYFIYYKSNKKK